MKGTITVVEMPGPCPIHKLGDTLTFGAEGDGGYVEGHACMPGLELCLKVAQTMRWEGTPEGPARVACPDNDNVIYELRYVS